MSKEAMQLALEALEEIRRWTDRWTTPGHPVSTFAEKAITALREALNASLAEQPAQQEPVDFASLLREAEELVREKPTWKRFIEGTPLSNDIAVWMTVFAQDVARRTSPPAQRTWVGLTDEETLLIFATCHEGWAYPQDAQFGPRAMRLTEGRAIEAKLKEKNT